MSDNAITNVYAESVCLYQEKVYECGLQPNAVISASGKYKPDHEAVQLAVAQKRAEARRMQSRLMTEVMNNSQLLLYKLDGKPLPQGIAMRRASEVSPEYVAQSLKTSIGYFPDSKTAAAMIKAGMPAPTYKSVMKDQLSGEKKYTEASTVESERKPLKQRKGLSMQLAQAEKKLAWRNVKRRHQEGVGRRPL